MQSVEEQPKEDKPKRLTLSYSSISTFRQCIRKYYYQYVLRLPTKEKDYFILGKMVHYVLEIFYKEMMSNQKQLLGPLMGASFKQAREKFVEADDAILMQAKNMLQDYLGRVIAKREFPKEMLQEEKFEIEIDGVPVTGVIDRIDFNNNNEATVIDYKTGKRIKDPKDFDNDLQLPIYAIVASEKYNIPLENLVCKLDHIKAKKEQRLKPNQELVKKAKDQVKNCYSEIQRLYAEMETDKQPWSVIGPESVITIRENKEWSAAFEARFISLITHYSKYWQKKEGWYCNYCDFQRICTRTLW
jgi:RecB family exonuclease